MIFGFAHKHNGNPSSYSSTWYRQWLRLLGSHTISDEHIRLNITAARQIEVRRNDETILGTTTWSFNNNTWHYIEIKIYLDPSTGTLEIRADGSSTPILNLSGVDTAGINLELGVIQFGRVWNVDTYTDDFYLLDTEGSYNNDFLGDCVVQDLLPFGAGSNTDFTPLAGSNYENVDDDPGPDSDTTYNSSSTVGNKDTYAMENLPSGGVPYGVKSQIVARKLTGTRGMKILTYSGGNEYKSDEIFLGVDYRQHNEIHNVNPDDSLPWEKSDIDGLEVGMEVST